MPGNAAQCSFGFGFVVLEFGSGAVTTVTKHFVTERCSQHLLYILLRNMVSSSCPSLAFNSLCSRLALCVPFSCLSILSGLQLCATQPGYIAILKNVLFSFANATWFYQKCPFLWCSKEINNQVTKRTYGDPRKWLCGWNAYCSSMGTQVQILSTHLKSQMWTSLCLETQSHEKWR